MNSEIRNTKHKTQNTKHKTPNPSRSAFTLVELLVVIVILLIVASLAFAVFKGNSTDKMRSAARIAQSAFLGAKDRALHAKDLRGIRLIRDPNGPTFMPGGVSNGIPSTVNGFVYLQPLPPQSYPVGSFQLERIDLVTNANGNPPPDGLADSTDIVILHGFDASSPPPAPVPAPSGFVDWSFKSQFFSSGSRIQIPDGNGQWYQFTTNTSGPYKLGTGSEYLQLVAAFQGGTGNPWPAVVAFNCSTTNPTSCRISLGNDVLPFHQPIPLPSGCVIDLQYSSPNVQTLAGAALSAGSSAPFVDIMYSPRGAVSGYLAGLGPLHFLLRDLKDATAGVNPIAVGISTSANPDLSTGDRLILTVFPQTGLVQVFEIDPTDVLTNGTAAGPPDGLADNIFNFAQQGKAAGR